MQQLNTSTRQLKVAESLRKAITQIIRKDFQDVSIYLSVSMVIISGDLKSAKVIVKTLFSINTSELISFMNSNAKIIKREISKYMVLKFVPDLVFVLSDEVN